MKSKSFNDLKTFMTVTLGCKVNTYESNIIANDLLSYGLIQVDEFDNADLIIINTCSVTNTADSKSRNMIARANKLNPDAIILVCGCYSQVASSNLKEKYGIDILLGNKYKNDILKILNEFFVTNKQLIKIDNLLLENEFELSNIEVYKEQTRAFVKIQDGCNFMCSYCIIPFTRGRQRSKNFEYLINEIKTLISNGYKEIVLTGVNTAGYENNGHDFYSLLLSINNLKGDFRIRISSVEPFQITDEIVNLICNNPKRFAQHWHICLQSGSDNVLRDMNRKYTTEQFLNLVNKIYTLNPNTAISTDYICGFPTETSEDHLKSIDLIEKIGFLKLHVFPYSKRSYTPAARLKSIYDNLKTDRVKEMINLSNKLTTQFIKKFIGKTVDVLFETFENNTNKGKTSEYFNVIVESTNNYVNQMMKVKITRILLDCAFGEIVKE